jgi:hypothetical protein
MYELNNNFNLDNLLNYEAFSAELNLQNCDNFHILNNLIRIKKLGANGKKIILKECNWGNEAQKLINFYVKLESIHSR